MRSLLNSYGMCKLILNTFKMLKEEIDKKEQKNKHRFFPKKELKDCCIQTFLYIYKNANNNFFSLTKELFKEERQLNLNNINNRNVTTKIMVSSHNFAINTNKCYNLQGDMKNCKNCERKEIQLNLADQYLNLSVLSRKSEILTVGVRYLEGSTV